MSNFFPTEYVALAMILADSNEEFKKTYNGRTGEYSRDWVEQRIGSQAWSPSPGAKRGIGGGLVYISPCGKFILKHSGMFIDGEEDAAYLMYGVPTFFTRCPREQSHQWVLQPIADISEKAVDVAYEYFREVYEKVCAIPWQERKSNPQLYVSFGDLHRGNVGMWNGKPYLIDF